MAKKQDVPTTPVPPAVPDLKIAGDVPVPPVPPTPETQPATPPVPPVPPTPEIPAEPDLTVADESTEIELPEPDEDGHYSVRHKENGLTFKVSREYFLTYYNVLEPV